MCQRKKGHYTAMDAVKAFPNELVLKSSLDEKIKKGSERQDLIVKSSDDKNKGLEER